MARKGKAWRRVKDWEQQFRADDQMDAAESQTLQPQRVKLPSFRTDIEGDLANRPTALGLVTGIFPAGACVRCAGRELICSIAGIFRPPRNSSALAVGDIVTVAMSPPEQTSGRSDKQRSDGAIISRELRETVLARPEPTSGKHRGQYGDDAFVKVVAANMEVMLIVASVRQPVLRPALVDRFCIAAERGDLKPVVAFNKVDLGLPDAELEAELSEGGIATFRISALTGQGLDQLRLALAGKKSVLAGPSGAGKSTLINVLVPGANLTTREIRQKDQRGRHVTAAATLHELPGGGILVDTPGVRELALGIDAGQLPWFFPELAAVAGQCHFNNCTHTHEPDCAVHAAVEEGIISARRFRSYLRILDTL